MDSARGPRIAGNSERNSDGKPKKRSVPNAKSLANLKPFQPGQSGNPSGRPKGTTMKEMLRRQANRVVRDLDGSPKMVDGVELVRGDLACDQLMVKAMRGDLRAIQVALQYDQDRPNPIGAGELVPGTNVYVTANAQANAQVEQPKEGGRPSLADRMRAIYNLGPRPIRGTAAASVAVAVSGES
jgi:hypothetical protein